MSYEEIYIAIWITNVYMYCILVTHEYVLLLKLILHATVIAMGQSQLGTACLIQWLNFLIVLSGMTGYSDYVHAWNSAPRKQ